MIIVETEITEVKSNYDENKKSAERWTRKPCVTRWEQRTGTKSCEKKCRRNEDHFQTEGTHRVGGKCAMENGKEK